MVENCFRAFIFVLVLLTSDSFGQQCSCPPTSATGCYVQTPIIPVELTELLGPSCTRIAYPQVVVNAEVATFNDKATCIKYYLRADENECGVVHFKQSSKLVCNGEYVEEYCNMTQLSPGIFEFNCPRIHTVYYEHIHYFNGPDLISTTCLYVNEAFVDQMSAFISTDRRVDQSIIKKKFCDVGIRVKSAEVLEQAYCDN